MVVSLNRYQTFFCQVLALVVWVMTPNLANAFAPLDEIVISESTAPIVSGDFDCSSFGFAATADGLRILPDSSGLRTGELWAFFKNQGLDHIDRLVLCLDIPPDSYKHSDVKSIQLEIRDANDPTRIIERYSLDSNSSIVLPGYEASQYRAEAQLAVSLNYDFMEKFSQASDEKVVLSVQIDGESIVPDFYISAQASWFSGLNMITLALFVSFWVVVFVILFRFTNPDRRSLRSAALPREQKQVLST